MDDLQREKKWGLSFWYLGDVRLRRRLAGRYRVPGFGLGALLFATLAKVVLERLGRDRGEAVVKEAVQRFGRERGRRIADKVSSLGKPLSFKNWLVYSDIDGDNFATRPYVEDGDLVAPVTACAFHEAAASWGLQEYSSLYCKYADHAILEGYNPEIRLSLRTRYETGADHCLFRYAMKERRAERV